MTTFVPCLSNGLVAFNTKWNISEKERMNVKLADSISIQQQLTDCFQHHENFTKSSFKLTVKNVQKFNNYYEEIGDFETSSKVLKLALQLCDQDSTLSDKTATKDNLKNQLLWYQFMELTTKAKKESDLKNYNGAKKLYDQAFKLGILRGTHIQRMQSLEAFAMANDKEGAFEQLRLLAEYFILRGSRSFVNNPNLVSLHQDKRWKKYIKQIDNNRPN
jgi:tetratricopeptide (TPR) repeat protein